jgi:hypothetical protein
MPAWSTENTIAIVSIFVAIFLACIAPAIYIWRRRGRSRPVPAMTHGMNVSEPTFSIRIADWTQNLRLELRYTVIDSFWLDSTQSNVHKALLLACS